MIENDDIREKGYLHETFRLFHNTDILGIDTPAHFHSFYKVTFVRYGRGSYMIDGRTYDIQSGDIVLVGINVPHRPVFEAGELYDRYTVYISSALLEKFDTPDCHISEIFSSTSANVIRPDRKNADRFIKMFERIETEKQSGSFGASLASEMGVLWFLIEAARCRQGSLQVPLENSEDDRMLAILRAVNESLGSRISLPELAERFDMDTDDMKASFQEAFGCPLEEYITSRALTRAREMIMQGTAPAEACYACGYKNISEFTESYRKKFGSAPKCPGKEETGEALSVFFPD
ncbi:MAG: helix-turn-helix domain-containing protein [Lachnospiraceae bacterium]|nr:helix-turn-helix domain-containing protein [Lachnospiraceae bacterium]